jgi:glycosyltransferase involved in cell wall biosynthesis
VLNYAAQQWTTDAALPILAELPYARCLATCGFSGLSQPDYTKFFRDLPKHLQAYDRLICHSATYQDFQFLAQHDLASNTTIIANGCGEDEFGSLPTDFRAANRIEPDQFVVLSLGSHTGLKGHEFAIQAFRKARIPKAVLLIVGNVPPGCYKQYLKCQAHAWRARLASLGQIDIRLVNLPRREVLGAYHAADVLVLASQVEAAPLVLYEAAASATPFISSDVGNATEIAEQTQAGIMVRSRARTPGRTLVDVEALADALRQLAADIARRETMAKAGRAAWLASHTWETITTQYDSLYRTLIETRKAQA